MMPIDLNVNADLDLVLEREVPVAPALVWRAWTEPELLKQWFCPAPWKTTHCEIDLRPGGIFRTVMEGPDGERNDSTGCYLQVIPGSRLVFCDALGPGFRPNGSAFMTGIICIQATGSGTRYTAMARHADTATRIQHEEMGFQHGWGAALDQLVALMS